MSRKEQGGESAVSPFLRWAGGKSWLLPQLSVLLLDLEFRDYYEPFLGSGAAFFALKGSHKSFLSDMNEDLILTYQAIKDSPGQVYEALIRLKNTEEEYYRIRSRKCRTTVTKAARFIYLNQTSYNGLYRVNSKGEYNVPYGFRRSLKFDKSRIEKASKFLVKQNAVLSHQDFEDALASVRCEDFVFLDPPYTVSKDDENGFIEYNEKIFSLDDQKRLRRCIDIIKEKKAYYLLTNAHHPRILSIFGNSDRCIEVHRQSCIGGKNARRGLVREYVFTNIPMKLNVQKEVAHV